METILATAMYIGIKLLPYGLFIIGAIAIEWIRTLLDF